MAQYGLLGRRLGHSWSPEIHGFLGSVPYRLYETEPENLGSFLETTPLSALNVTIPYKKDVIPYCTELSETAKKLGSVNTMVRRKNGWFGDNTDYYGFCKMLESAGMDPAGKKALILGSGGASLTVQAALRDLKAKSVTVISRSGPDNYDNLHLHADAEIIVNTTPVGMYPNQGQAPVDLRIFPKCVGVADLIYNPQKTKLLLDAEDLGIPCCGGLTMLVAQAKRASEIFTGRTLPDSQIPEITRQLQKKMRNIVLIGMPGCGKSTVAELLSRHLGIPAVDADREIEKIAGLTIPEIFERDSEEGFRALETRVLRELGGKTGQIISTGGGCVTREENYASLRQNGVIIWLRRDIHSLAADGRPLSLKGDLQEMYNVRRPLYERLAQHTVDNDCTPQETAEKILEVIR